ncbi:MAG: AmmeMemoRadiSam system protein B [Verrucomicrobiales bacterium]
MPEMNSTQAKIQPHIREAAVAGKFYPRKAELLQRQVDDCIAAAGTDAGKRPKAIIGPHAGYVFSGVIAGSAYAPLLAACEGVKRVVIIGPSHYVPFKGIAIPSCDAFETPFGLVQLDRAGVSQALQASPCVVERDDAHAQEHGLEVHLPFLQTVCASFELIPLVTGEVACEAVATVLERLWGGPETLMVISSDLSHFYDYATAQTLDRQTSDAILALDPEAIEEKGACGRLAIQGLLSCARAHRLRPALLDLRNSGDTAGDRQRVVGYGAYAFYD